MSACRPFVGAWTHALLALLSCAPIAAQALFAELTKGSATAYAAWSGRCFAGDLDGDGDEDALIGSGLDLPLRLFWNDGHGHFEPASTNVLPNGIVRVVQITGGDFDRDGDIDLLLATIDPLGYPGPARLLRNDPAGFVETSATHLPIGTQIDFRAALGDLDGDGDLDVAVPHRTGPFQLVNQGNGSFTRVPLPFPLTGGTPFEFAVGDLDRDGRNDLIGVGGVFASVWLGGPQGTFVDVSATHLPSLFLGPRFELVLADMDFDRDLDLVAGESSGPGGAVLFANDGTGRLRASPSTALPTGPIANASPVVGDHDGDGDLDVFVAEYTGAVWFRRDSASAWSRVPVEGPRWIGHATSIDADGDGTDDVLFVDEHGGPHVLRHDGHGGLSSSAGLRLSLEMWSPSGPFANYVQRFADLDGDGAPEHVAVSALGCVVDANDGNGWFRSRTSLPLPSANTMPTTVEVVDLDGDGDRDVLFAAATLDGSAAPFLFVHRNDGTGLLSVPATPLVPPAVVQTLDALRAIDLDRDGDVDVVLAVDGLLRVFETTGAGILTDRTTNWLGAPTPSLGAVVAFDLERDGDDDLLLLAREGSGSPNTPNVLLRNDGPAGFVDVSARLLGLASVHAAAGDVDGDGDADLVSDLAGSVVLLRNTGIGAFVSQPIASGPTGDAATRAKSLVDVDLDGDLDVALVGTGLFVGDGTGAFVASVPPVVELAALGPAGSEPDATFVDLDRDGDLDVARNVTHFQWVFSNTLRQTHTPHAPRVGRPFRIEVFARQGTPRALDLACPYVATSGARVLVPGIGTVLLDAASAVPLPPLVVPQPEGQVTFDLALPALPVLVGLELHCQTAILQAPNRIVLTNATIDVVDR